MYYFLTYFFFGYVSRLENDFQLIVFHYTSNHINVFYLKILLKKI